MDPLYELQKIQDSGIRFSVQQTADSRITIKLGDYHQAPVAQANVDNFEQAVSWLREQVKARYPDSVYARRLLIN